MFEIALSRGYNEYLFKEDMKKLFYMLGVERKSMVFLFTAAQVVEEGTMELKFIVKIFAITISRTWCIKIGIPTFILSFISAFLEFINNILTIGIIPALFSDDEKENIMSSVRPYALESGFGVTK